MDAILVPAAARAGREDEKLAPVALNEVAVGIPLLENYILLHGVSTKYRVFARNI